MQVKRKTFEDLFGNVADSAKDAIDSVIDDAKGAFDEIFERTAKKDGPAVRGAIGGTGTPTADVTGAIAQLSGSVKSMTDAVEALAALPEPIAELTKLISSLLASLQAPPGAGVAGV